MTDKQFIKKIKQSINRKGITMYQISKKGVNGQLYKRAIDDKGSITLKTALKLAEIAGLKVILTE